MYLVVAMEEVGVVAEVVVAMEEVGVVTEEVVAKVVVAKVVVAEEVVTQVGGTPRTRCTRRGTAVRAARRVLGVPDV